MTRPLMMLAAALLCSAPALAADPPATDLFLAGGALATCSELSPRSCREARTRAGARQPPRFVFDADGLQRALDPLLWQPPGAPSHDALHALLDHARRHAGTRAYDARAAADLLDGICVDAGRRGPVARPCRDAHAPRPWRQLLDEERSTLLAAFEVPQIVDGARARERADPANSRDPGGNRVLEAFIEAARERAGGARPTIAIVTASAWDPFDPVDFYLGAFEALGAEALWWPVDAALNRAVFDDGHCKALDERRRDTLGLPARTRVYPDLAAGQQRACESAPQLAQIPSVVHGMFFAGGDQWRLRRAFFDARDQPNAWLRVLREAHAAGTLVVGGTSAGAAVQSGAAMLSNGTPREALRAGALPGTPPAPGCGRSGRCPEGMGEDSFTYWPDGGLGLATGMTVDTHFSERAREVRLLRLLADTGTRFGVGVDEASALQVRRHGDAGIGDIELRAHGAAGGWLFDAQPGCQGDALRAQVHFIAPGAVLRLDAQGGVTARMDAGVLAAGANEDTRAPRVPDDALADGALRAAVQAIAAGRDEVLLPVGDAGIRARLASGAQTTHWRAAGADYAGIGPLTLEVGPVDTCVAVDHVPAGGP